MPTAGALRIGIPVLLLCAAAACFVGCGSGHAKKQPVIVGDESFAGMPNPGSLGQAIERFGMPDEMFAPAEGGHECTARWQREGIDAEFVDWGAIGESVKPCEARSDLVLVFVTLRGDWEADLGLRIGDSQAELERIYDPGPAGSCSSFGSSDARMLRQVADHLGGPGAHLCTLGVETAHGEVTAFVMSSLAASE